MTLPSQLARPSPMARTSVFRRRKRSPVVPALAAAGVVVVAVAGWMAFGGGSDRPRTPPAGAPPSVVHKPASAADPTSTALPPVVPRVEAATAPAPVESPASDAVETPADEAPREPAPKPPAPPELSAVQKQMAAAEESARRGDLVKARETYNRALLDPSADEAERQMLRERLTAINDDLLFSPKIHPAEGNTEQYTVQSGDSLVKIARARGLNTHFRLIARVNRLSSPDKITLNQRLKLVKGPFHAVVRKSAFRLDIYLGPGGEPGAWTYVRSFRVGLGEGDSTPIGAFIVRKNSKLENPFWVNPRTGEKFDANDPKNPIGERWIGLEGQGEAAVYQGYGIHGTVEPESIGQMRSMGCVRMLPDDVEFVYTLLSEGVSVVRVEP